MSKLSTIGYEGASMEDFLATLDLAEVDVVLDIRQVPTSRRPGFSKRQLRDALEARGIRYYHLVGLGDPKEGRIAARQGRYSEFRRIFGLHMATDKAQADLEIAACLAEADDACLLCYERKHDQCHRSIVADALAQRIGVRVHHLGVRAGLSEDVEGKRPRTSLATRESAAACR